jgi:hypothetical protein
MQANKATGSVGPAVASSRDTSDHAQHKEAQISLEQCFTDVNMLMRALAAAGEDSKCEGASCCCAGVPEVIWQLEQVAEQQIGFSVSSVHECSRSLALLATFLLHGGHSRRAFSRTSQA